MIISIRKEGLCNRLKSLVSAMRLQPDDVWVYWKPEINIYQDLKHQKVLHRSPLQFNDLFQNPIAIDKPFPENAILYDSWRFAVLSSDSLPVGFSDSQFSDRDKKGRNIDLEYTRIPQSLRQIYIELFQQLILQEHLQQEVNRFVADNFTRKFIGIHLRSWNDRAGIGRRHNFSLEHFIAVMKSYKSQQRFFIASDSSEIIERLAITFPEQVVFYPTTQRTTQTDLIELYILGKSRQLIGSKDSTFSEIAWYLEGCPDNVRIL